MIFAKTKTKAMVLWFVSEGAEGARETWSVAEKKGAYPTQLILLCKIPPVSTRLRLSP